MTKKWLQAYFKGDNPSPDDLPLAERGTAFQQRVWLALSEIPMGKSEPMVRLVRQSLVNPHRL
ncbi:hypothetical protein ACXOM5_02575 [Streptococcus thermophilus]